MDVLIGLLWICLIFGLMLAIPSWLIWVFILGGKGKSIRRKFQAAGPLVGKTIAQIEAIGGEPIRMGSGSMGRDEICLFDLKKELELVARRETDLAIRHEIQRRSKGYLIPLSHYLRM